MNPADRVQRERSESPRIAKPGGANTAPDGIWMKVALVLGGAFMLGTLVVLLFIFGGIVREGGLSSLILFGTIGGVLVRCFSPDRFPEGGKGWLVAILLGMGGFVAGLILLEIHVSDQLHISSPIMALILGVVVTLVGAHHLGEFLE